MVLLRQLKAEALVLGDVAVRYEIVPVGAKLVELQRCWFYPALAALAASANA
jgi:hypothetical protein